MDSDVWAGRWAVDGEGGGGDDVTFDAKYLKYSTVRYIIIQYSIIQYSTVLYCTVVLHLRQYTIRHTVGVRLQSAHTNTPCRRSSFSTQELIRTATDF